MFLRNPCSVAKFFITASFGYSLSSPFFDLAYILELGLCSRISLVFYFLVAAFLLLF